ncbi:MAG TPA: hypothetical protein VGC39_11555 [Candidatus Methylacidiphilales bacterium]
METRTSSALGRRITKRRLASLQDRMTLVTSAAAKYPDRLGLKALREDPFVLITHQRSPTFYGHALELWPNMVSDTSQVSGGLAVGTRVYTRY